MSNIEELIKKKNRMVFSEDEKATKEVQGRQKKVYLDCGIK